MRTVRIIRIIGVLLGVFILGNILRIWEGPRCGTESLDLSPGRDSLTAYINIRSGMYTAKGFLTGFQYTLLTGFADSMDRSLGIMGMNRRQDCWTMLSDGLVDIVAVDVSDSIPEPYAGTVSLSMPFRSYAWAVRQDDHALLHQVNMWLGLITKGLEYSDMERRFFRSYDLSSYIENGTRTGRISPYDDIVKRQSRLLGWDWRLLSAVIFKESRFSMGARSRRGAVGLMQVKPSTAAVYGVYDLFDPEENVKAGTMFLRQIQKRYTAMGLDSVNVVKFTLAAYNAGESRIGDCINFTLDQGLDFTDWETVASAIPLMAEPEYYEDAEYLRHGKFRGGETIRYVRDVLSIYEEYLSVVE